MHAMFQFLVGFQGGFLLFRFLRQLPLVWSQIDMSQEVSLEFQQINLYLVPNCRFRRRGVGKGHSHQWVLRRFFKDYLD